MFKCHPPFTAVLACAAMAIAAPNATRAAMFDAILPASWQIGTHRISGYGFSHWGWMVATQETIMESDLSQAVFSGAFDDPAVIYLGQRFVNAGTLAPLTRGDVAGLRLDYGVQQADNTVYDALLAPGESLTHPSTSFWYMALQFPENFERIVAFTGSIALGQYRLAYTTQVHFVDYDGPGEYDAQLSALGGQRGTAAAMPGPSSLWLIISGSLPLLVRKAGNDRRFRLRGGRRRSIVLQPDGS